MALGPGGYMQLAGMGYNMVGAYKQAQSQKAMLRYQAKVAQNNAQIAEWQAQQEGLVGAAQEQTSRLRTAQVFGAQRAAMAGNGIDLGQGVATDILASTKFMGERDALTIRDNSARKQWAMRLKAQGYADEASVNNAQAGAISPGGSAIGSLLGDAGTAASVYKQYKGS